MDLALVKGVFERAGVTTALLVDDAYDPAPPIGDQEAERAFQLFEESDVVEDAFTAAGGVRPADPAHLLQQLHEVDGLEQALRRSLQGEEDQPLRPLANALYGAAIADKEGQLRPLEELRKLLEALGIEATPVGSDGPGPEADKYPLIFMDYYLGDKGIPSVKKSRERIMEIVSRYRPEERPIVILMSSELKLGRLAREFRDEAELLGCQFKFVMKGSFQEEGFSFVTSLADLVQFLGQSRVIGGFVEAWKRALLDAADEFKKGIRQLDLQDYFHIRTRMGPNASQRFGEHMSGLFDGFLRKLIEDRPALRTATAAMNAVDFDDQPPAPFAPSEMVARMAHAAAFQTLPNPPKGDAMDLELGDVFFKEVIVKRARRKEVCVVISQACDLEHGKTKTILLIKGTVTKRTAKKLASGTDNRPIIRTDIFQHDGEDLIIDWDASDLMTVPVAGFEARMEELNFEKVTRLRSVQALALQQKFAAHLTRVGMPVTPPPYRYPMVDVFYRTAAGAKTRLLDAIPRSQRLACVVGDEKPEAVLQEPLFDRIRTGLAALPEGAMDEAKLAELKATLSDVGRLRELRGMRLQNGRAEMGTIVLLDREKQMTAGDGMPGNASLAICMFDD